MPPVQAALHRQRKPSGHVRDDGPELRRDRKLGRAGQLECGRHRAIGLRLGCIHPIGIHHEGLTDGDQRQAHFTSVHGLCRRPYLPGCNERDPPGDACKEMLHHRNAVGIFERPILQQACERGMNIVDARIDEPVDEDEALIDAQTAVAWLFGRNTIAERERSSRFGADNPADFGNDGEREAHAIFQRSAPFIDSPVGARRQEVLDQETMGAMQLDPVEACQYRPARRITESRDDVCDLDRRKRTDWCTPFHKGAGLDQSSTRAHDIAIRNEGGQRLVAGVENLKDCRGTTAFGRIGETSQTGQKMIVVGCELVGEADSVGGHMAAAGNDETDTADAGPAITVFLVRNCGVVVC